MTLRRLGLVDEPRQWSSVVGVLTGPGGDWCRASRRRCAKVSPEVDVRIVVAPPMIGAGLRGLDRIGADPAALRKHRSRLPPRGAARLSGVAISREIAVRHAWQVAISREIATPPLPGRPPGLREACTD
ncbi:hypothetical protein [Saccharopolyspora hattusasensis]|uniref:hypothetical protein n=1 Tax=Saccharopolyspora hattusasensis TaxID=1128679 RepID=UPI003D97DDC8